MTKEEVIDLIRDSGFGVLATDEGNQPRVRPMMPYLTDDNRLIIALLPQSRSIQQIEANPQVEVCFVDRKMWFARVTGKASISNSIEDKEILWNNVPMLKQYFGGLEDPNFKVLGISISNVEASTPHQKMPEKVVLS
jgi:general stress protein 26